MLYVLSANQMKQCDYNTIHHFGIPSCVLMERAALGVVDVLTERIDKDARVLVFVGVGNNGGDGVCVARILYNLGYDVTLLMCGDEEKFSPDLREQLDIADKYGILKITTDDIGKSTNRKDNNINRIGEYDVFVDAIFGIGLSRDVEGRFAECIKAFNEADGLKIAIDMPSGINTDTGSVCGIACKVDITVTFNYLKSGHLLYPGRECSGDTIVKDIGINDNSFLDDISPSIYYYERNDLDILNNRKADTNKGYFGKVLVIAGHEGMSGAAYLAAKAVLRMGAGLVKIYTTSDNGDVLRSQLPECLMTTYESYDEESLQKELNWSTECVIGPGIGTDETVTLITKYVLNDYNKPLVIDADALNIISGDLSLLVCRQDNYKMDEETLGDGNGYDGECQREEGNDKLHYNRIITPHPGEMSRLCGMDISHIKKDMVKVSRDFADKYGVITVLKAASTVTSIPNGKSYINTSGNNGMATGGSGDVLTGIIAGIIANGIAADVAAGLGVYLHGLCGDYAAEKYNKHYIIASDIIEAIGKVI